jgi:hypothetical protein
MKLNSQHLEFVLECLKENTTEIRNIKKYLLAVLFNAPSTMSNYAAALVACKSRQISFDEYYSEKGYAPFGDGG